MLHVYLLFPRKVAAVLILRQCGVGLDLSSAYDAVVPARGKILVKTDISIAIPEGTYARVGE
jgi:dUTPase